MSYFNEDYDLHDKRYFQENAPDPCDHCERTDAVLFDYRTDDDKQLRLCNDCSAEERKQEQLREQLAIAADQRAIPSSIWLDRDGQPVGEEATIQLEEFLAAGAEQEAGGVNENQAQFNRKWARAIAAERRTRNVAREVA